MRRLVPLAAMVLLAGAGSAAPRDDVPGAARLRFMAGECDRLSVSGRTSKECRPTLVSLVYANGVMSFVFTGADGRLLSFRTRMQRSLGVQAQLKVDQVTLVSRGGGSVRSLPARGSCTLTPFAVDRSRLDCTARAGGVSFAGLFRTSDQPPRLLTLASR